MNRYGTSLGSGLVLIVTLSISTHLLGAPLQNPAPGQIGAPTVLTAAEAAPLIQQVSNALEVSTATVQSLNFVQRAVDGFSTAVVINGQTSTLTLTKHSVRSPDFQLYVQDATGSLIPTPALPPITYKGIIEEWPDALVRGSFVDGKLDAVVYTQDEIYGIQPLANLGMNAAEGQHAVYRASTWENRGAFSCGTDENRHIFKGAEHIKFNPGDAATRGTGLKITDIGLDADFEYYVLNGSNVNNTLQDMELIINGVEAIYEAETQITYEVTTVIIRTAEPDPYTSSNPETLLTGQFQTHWNTSPQTFIRRDTAHLFTGKNIDGGVIGIAYLNAICNTLSNAYGLSESRFSGNLSARISLTAHELGHNWSCPHCDGVCTPYPNCCRIMCSGLGGCSGILTSFGTHSANQIIAFRNSRSCLSDLGDPQTLPFFENFANGTLDAAKWSYNFNGSISTNASNEPSAPNSFELDAEGSENFRDNDLRSNFIQLNGLSNVRLSYWTQHVGVENGEQLVVEYWASNNLWTEINRITSNGVDETTFNFQTHILPANAHHAEFRVRFRPEVGDSGDNWYVDDITVSTNCTIDSDCNDGFHCNGVETCVGTICLPGTPPLCPGQLCSEALDQCVNCLTNADCSNGVFCDGAEICDGTGNCGPGNFPCTNPDLPVCREASDTCVECLVNGDCTDGIFCNGAETCSGTFTCSAGANPCPGQACQESTDTCQEPGDMYCVLPQSSTPAGSTVPVEIYLSGLNNNVRSYQSTLTTSLTSGTGSVSVVCPGGTLIDVNDPDYIFYNLPNDFPTTNCAQKRVSAALTAGAVFVADDPVYLGTVMVTVSGDAAAGSTFDLGILSGGGTYVRDENNLAVVFDILSPCELSIAECNPCQLYGDVQPTGTGAFIGDCDVDVDDLVCILNGFADPVDCPSGDIEPCPGDGDIDADDILAILAAFVGAPACPDPC